jgi:hypothetical protein
MIRALGLALILLPQLGRTQADRDFVFTDEEGHLVVRFHGTGATGLDSSQADEILNAELSSMVHDRLRADLLFESEPRDAGWAARMEPQLEQHLEHAGPEFTKILVGCRTTSCRVVMEQPRHWSVNEHQAVLKAVQESVEAFIAARQPHFKPVFMITAYDQEPETPHIKVFLRRTQDNSTPARM